MASSGNSFNSSCLTNSHLLLLSVVFVKSSFVWSHSIVKARTLLSNKRKNNEFHINRWEASAERVFASRAAIFVVYKICVGSWGVELLSTQPGSTSQEPNSWKLRTLPAICSVLERNCPVWRQLKAPLVFLTFHLKYFLRLGRCQLKCLVLWEVNPKWRLLLLGEFWCLHQLDLLIYTLARGIYHGGLTRRLRQGED